MPPRTASLQKRYERLQLLYRVSQVIHSTLDPQEALQLILQQAVEVMRASSGSIVLINPTTGFLDIQASLGLPRNASELKLKVGEGITGWVAEYGKPARVGTVKSDARYIMLHPNICSELAVPLQVEDETRGVINVDADSPNAFTEDDEDLLQELAQLAAKVIHKTWLFEQFRLKARLFESLAKVSQTINSTINVDEALKAITKEACLLMDAKMCSLLMLDASRDWLDLRASFGAGAAYVHKPRLAASESLVGIVVRRRKPVQIENVQVSARYQNVDVARQEGLVSLLSVPLLYDDECIGALNVYTGELHSFSNEEIRILSALAELSAIALEKARLYERIVDVEEQLRQAEKFSALGLLAAEVAHEIRNPLTVMKMLYHSLDLQFGPEDPRSRDAQIIGEKMEQLNKIVEQILDFARSSEPEFRAVNVTRLLDDLILLVRHKLSNHRIALVRKLCDDLHEVRGDSTHLSQVFLNITLNAVEAMPEGGQLTIATTVKKQSDDGSLWVVIEFRDTGIGLTPEQQRQAFSSVLQTTKLKGTGLGLAIVAKIIEAHEGRIQLKSRLGKGTTVSISFPAIVA